jgi:hypothetical protein
VCVIYVPPGPVIKLQSGSVCLPPSNIGSNRRAGRRRDAARRIGLKWNVRRRSKSSIVCLCRSFCMCIFLYVMARLYIALLLPALYLRRLCNRPLWRGGRFRGALALSADEVHEVILALLALLPC